MRGFVEELKKNSEEYKNTVTWYYTLSLSLSFLCLFIYFFIPTYSSTKDIKFLSEIIKDFYKPFIFYIYSSKYIFNDEEPIKLRTWSGTDEGCKCKENGHIKIEPKKCTEYQLLINCEDIFPVSPKILSKYRGQYFFKDRINIVTYTYKDILKDNKSYVIVENNEDCPKYYKQCGIFDSFKNKLCAYFSCPVNGINISNIEKIENYSKANFLPLDENKSLHYTKNNINGDIISDLFIFQDEPCYYSPEYNWDIFSQLEKGKGNGCQAKNGAKDNRYKLLDSYNQYKFYNNNNILSYSYLSLTKEKDRKKLNNSKVNLYYRNFIGFNHSCLKERQINDILEEFLYLFYTAEEDRLFYSRLLYDINKEIIERFGKWSLIWEFLKILLFFLLGAFNWYWFTNYSRLGYYMNIPELIFLFYFIYNFNKIQKQRRTVSEIVDNIIDCCDEYTKYGLQMLKKKDNIINISTYNGYIILLTFIIILTILYLILNYILSILIQKRDKCLGLEKHTLLSEEENNKEDSNDKVEPNDKENTNRIYELNEINKNV